MKSIDKFVLVLVASLALLLAGCGGGSSTPATPPAPPPPSAYEMALDAINAATTPEDAQAAYDAVKGQVTAAQGENLQMAVNDRQAALAKMVRADEQKMALMVAAGMVDTSDLSDQDKVDAARRAIAGLRQAIADAVDVADTSMYESQLATAEKAVEDAQGGIDTATRRMNQMTALSDASGMLQAALAALSGSTPTQMQLDAANAAVRALNAAITAGIDLTDAEKATYLREAANAAAPINTAQMAFDDAERDAQNKADMEMAAMAVKLYEAIGTTPLTANGSTTDVADATGVLSVQNESTTVAPLAENEDATVPSLHGWVGSEHTATIEEAAGVDNDGTYIARLYSNVGEPTQGAKFNSGITGITETATGSGVYTVPVDAANAGRIASPQFDHSAGNKEFELPDENDPPTGGIYISGGNVINIPNSSYYGVQGTYSCDTGTGATANTCIVTKAAAGYALGGSGTWAFKPNNAEDRVTEIPDDDYVVYGWWLHEDDDGATVSAFTAMRGTVLPAASVDTLMGSAIYKGGAAGKYTVRAGANNDAGHFTADAELLANFNNDTITGTINNFMGSDGMARDWSISLGASNVAPAGGITGSPTDSTDTGNQKTTWTMGGSAGNADGQWSGTLYDNNDGGVPQVGTGTFHSTYSNIGRMVGAFGVNLEE